VVGHGSLRDVVLVVLWSDVIEDLLPVIDVCVDKLLEEVRGGDVDLRCLSAAGALIQGLGIELQVLDGGDQVRGADDVLEKLTVSTAFVLVAYVFGLSGGIVLLIA
jgi:hypothetical protein